MSTAVASPPPPGAPSGGLALSLLGHPVVTVDGLVRPLRYGKSKALLAYLALQPLPVVRRTAAALFWESLPPDRAKANLRVILHDLRTCLGPYLWVDRTTIALDRTRLRTDVGRLEVAIAEARSPGSGDVLVDLLAAGSGDFLEGVELRDAPEAEAFVRLQRERIRRLTTDALIAALGSGDRSPGAGGPTLDEAQAAALISRLGLLEPWNEEGRRAVMGTYVRSGHPASALAIYREFRDGLHHGFGLVPEPATAALAASIAEASGIPLTSPGDRPTSPVTAPLFGRREEVETVCRALADGHRLVTVTGPGGVGKSRLALEVAGRYPAGRRPRAAVGGGGGGAGRQLPHHRPGRRPGHRHRRCARTAVGRLPGPHRRAGLHPPRPATAAGAGQRGGRHRPPRGLRRVAPGRLHGDPGAADQSDPAPGPGRAGPHPRPPPGPRARGRRAGGGGEPLRAAGAGPGPGHRRPGGRRGPPDGGGPVPGGRWAPAGARAGDDAAPAVHPGRTGRPPARHP